MPPFTFGPDLEGPTEGNIGASKRPLPSLYHVLDKRGKVLWEGKDGHEAWLFLINTDAARVKCDGADHYVVFAIKKGILAPQSEAYALRKFTGLEDK